MRKIQVANESAPLGERLAVASPGPTTVANGGHGYAASISLGKDVVEEVWEELRQSYNVFPSILLQRFI